MKSIIFNTEMVKAVLDGRKTQFRIAMKDCDTFDIEETENGFNLIHNYKMRIENVGLFSSKELLINWFQSKYSKYKVDDILYVKETFQTCECGFCEICQVLNSIVFKADYNNKGEHPKLYSCHEDEIYWNPSIHLKQKDARIFLKITKVRVVRLQDISHEDCLKDGCKWEHNPYVFTYEFERINKED